MTSSYRDNIGDYYQLPDDIEPAGSEIVDSELLDLATGQPLVEASSQEQLTGETLETLVLTGDGNCTPVVIANEGDSPVQTVVTNREESEVSTSLLGIPRSETALVLFDTVNIYGVNPKEWAQGPDSAGYQYYYDPSDWTFADDFGYFWRHLPAESAIQAYVYPRPSSFVYPTDDGSGRFPGGYTNGIMRAYWQSKRAFRYQPGRVSGFTLGVRMSTQSGHDGEIIQWGCTNNYGDGYYFQLEKGTDLYIVRKSPDLGELKVAQADWNGERLLIGDGTTGWTLDLSKVTMFKIEFSWYGAVGAQFLAYIPDGVGEGRWVKLHYISAESKFTVPSLRSAYLRLFVSARTTAGTDQPAFINLYGSSVYIDGGDKGTVTLGTASLETPKEISSSPRSLLGLNVKAAINGVSNQKAIYPVGLAAYSSVPARFDVVFRSNSCGSLHYGYGEGSSLLTFVDFPYPVTPVGSNQLTITSGTFPDISGELSGSLNYLTGRRVRVIGTNIFDTHVTAVNPSLTTITVDRPVPTGTTSIRLARFDSFAVASGAIASGVTQGNILRRDTNGYWRIGLWPQASGDYDSSKTVVWAASSYPVLGFNSSGVVNSEIRYPSALGCNENSSFSIAINSGTPSYTITAGGNSLTVSGTANPWPIALVIEMMPSSRISDVTIFEGSNLTTVGSGVTKSITSFSTVSGIIFQTPISGPEYIAHKFEDALCDPLSAVLVDRQGSMSMSTADRVATYFIGADETKYFDLSNVFGPDKMFITGVPGTEFNSGGLFVVATARTGSGIASATLNWEEQ